MYKDIPIDCIYNIVRFLRFKEAKVFLGMRIDIDKVIVIKNIKLYRHDKYNGVKEKKRGKYEDRVYDLNNMSLSELRAVSYLVEGDRYIKICYVRNNKLILSYKRYYDRYDVLTCPSNDEVWFKEDILYISKDINNKILNIVYTCNVKNRKYYEDKIKKGP